jgi:Rps23 Pro-64 3,4-dihydroxylase Tpa1-like proline 4-hydroxylase
MFGKTLLEDKQFMKSGLEQPYLIIKNALLPEVAEQLYQELMKTNLWEKSDKSLFTKKEQALLPDSYTFTRENINLEDDGLPVTVKSLFEYLKSNECLQWISEIGGRKCDDFSGACARYYGGNHLTSHNDYYMKRLADNSVTTRTVTFNYYLTKDWQSEWGGNFIWEKPYDRIRPEFNTLVMFFVSNDSFHHVEQVSSQATCPRLAITGWFTTNRKPGSKKLDIAS